MKKKNLWIIVLVAIITIALFACGGNDPEPQHTHDWGEWQVTTAPTCETAGVETRTCKTCGETETRPLAALGHDFLWVVTTAPTATADGVETETCTRCNATRGTRPIAKLTKTYDLNLGEIPVVLEDQTGQLSATRVGIIQAALTTFATSSDPADTEAMALLNGRNIRIIIEDVPAYTTGNAHYRVVDGNTMYIRYERANTATDAQVLVAVRGGLRAVSEIAV